ncbi:MAG: DUF2796 domain-containing protein [Deltaproteobacteria bacterium]|nr:DUF2796 domain-containing protein [Deltaproteobacteria bacterium]
MRQCLPLGLSGLFFGLLGALSIVFGADQSAAQTHEAHEHGVAQLNVAVESSQVELDLDSPLINFISFEHPPSTPEQKEEVRRLGETLAGYGELFILTPEAGCKASGLALSSENIEASLLPPGTLADDAHGHAEGGHVHGDHDGEAGHGEHHEAGHDHEDGEHEHGDLEGRFVFSCQKPEALKSLEIKLFEKFPSLESINVQLVSDKGQRAASLNSKSPAINW